MLIGGIQPSMRLRLRSRTLGAQRMRGVRREAA